MLINEKKFLEGLESLINLTDNIDYKKAIINMAEKTKQKIIEFEWESKELTSITNIEKGLLNAFLNKIILNLIRKEGIDAKKGYDLDLIIDKSTYPKELLNAKIFIMRRTKWHSRPPLEEAANQFIIKEIKRIFLEQNKDYLCRV